MSVLKGIQRTINVVLDFFYPLFKSFLPKETFRYAATGGGNLVLDIVLYFVFFHFILYEQNLNLGFIVISPHIAAFLMVFPITFTTGFLLAKYITFTQSRLRGRKQLIRYGLTVFGSIILNYVLLKFFVEKMSFYPTPSKILTTSISIIYSFIAQKYFTFKTGKSQLQTK